MLNEVNTLNPTTVQSAMFWSVNNSSNESAGCFSARDDQGRRSRFGGGGGAKSPPLHFSRGKMFLFKYKVHAVSTRGACHFTPYPGWNFLEKYLIENVENTISEPLDFKIVWERTPPNPPPQQTRVSGASFQAQSPPVEIALRRPWRYEFLVKQEWWT